MNRLILTVGMLVFILSCNQANNITGNSEKYPKDPNITAANCLGAGKSYDVPPGQAITDKCCDGFAPVSFSMSQDGSTGYSHFTCIYANRCTAEDQKAEYNAFIACCADLIIMDDKCVKKEKCSAEKEQILISGPLDQKECIDFPDCVKSGPISGTCEYCCPGSKYIIQMITGTRPQKCLGPDENPTEEETKYGWTEPEIITQEAFDEFKASCLNSHHP